MRVTISSSGILNVTSSPVPALPLSCLFPTSLSPDCLSQKPSYHIYLTLNHTEPDLFTSHKTTYRLLYDSHRQTLPSHDPQYEILLVNLDGQVMEGSIYTPYFLRDSEWITPSASCGGNLGTSRRWALQHGLCKEGSVRKDGVQIGEKVVLSNGVRGWGWGYVEELERE